MRETIIMILVVIFSFISICYSDTGIQIDIISNGMLSNTGQVLSSGKVLFYNTNSSIPKNVYRNADLTQSYGNEVDLDSSGKALVYALGTYRMVVKDSNDNTISDNSDLTFGYATPFPQYTKDGDFDSLNVGSPFEEFGISNVNGLYPQMSIINSSNLKYSVYGVDSDGNFLIDPNGINDGTVEILGNLKVENETLFEDDVHFNKDVNVDGTMTCETLIAKIIMADDITSTSTSSVRLPYVDSDTVEVGYLDVSKTAEVKYLHSPQIVTGIIGSYVDWNFDSDATPPAHTTTEVLFTMKDQVVKIEGSIELSNALTGTLFIEAVDRYKPKRGMHRTCIVDGNTVGIVTYNPSNGFWIFPNGYTLYEFSFTWSLSKRKRLIDGVATDIEWDYEE